MIPCIILLHFLFILKYIHAWTTKNLNTRHKPALFTKKLEIYGWFFFYRKRMLILSAIVLKGLRHDLRLKFLIFMYLNGLSA